MYLPGTEWSGNLARDNHVDHKLVGFTALSIDVANIKWWPSFHRAVPFEEHSIKATSLSVPDTNMVAFNPHYFMQQIFIICVALDEFLNPSKVVLVQRLGFEITILFCYPWTCFEKPYLSPAHPYTTPPKTRDLYGAGWLINSFFSWRLERASANRLKVRKYSWKLELLKGHQQGCNIKASA